MNIAIIPARGGSRRIPRKNIRPFFGKPMIAYSIEAAKKSGLFYAVFVSTDDTEIEEVALDYGAFIMSRPASLAADEVGTQEVMHDALKEVEATYACCVYPCVPMLHPDDLLNGYNLCRVLDDYAYVPGWFYWGRTEWFGVKPLSTEPSLIVDPQCSERYIDINEESDWVKAEAMFAALKDK